MYPHHETSIQNLVALYQDDPGVLAIFLVGSIAKGRERPDSDVDAIIIVTEEKYRQLSSEQRLTECVWGHCTYEKGYFDIKYSTKAYLAAAAERGSEPSRNAFLSAKCLFARDPDIEPLVSRIPVFMSAEKNEKMLSFYSTFALFSGYFWRSSQGNPYLRHRAAIETVLYGLRMALEENEVLYPCHKDLMKTVKQLPQDTSALLSACERLLSEMSDEAKDAFVSEVKAFIRYQPPENGAEIGTRFIDDHELWWYKDRPVIAEW